MSWWNYQPRLSVAERRAQAIKEGERLKKRGARHSPVVLEGRTIASSFWGKAWCDNLESYRDYEYRLPRGRSYLRHRAVLDLQIEPGRIAGLVMGSELYTVQVAIQPLAKAHWTQVKSRCAGQIGSLIELLQGRLSAHVMSIITHRDNGLFPKPKEIVMRCSCPDSATMCKHVAAVMYGVGARLDLEPQLLFALRRVAHAEIIAEATQVEMAGKTGPKTIADDALSEIFGIELDSAPAAASSMERPKRRKTSGKKAKAKSKGRPSRRR